MNRFWQKCRKLVKARVARWNIFEPKIPIWANSGKLWNGKCWYIL
jgi:hypothetical protein